MLMSMYPQIKFLQLNNIYSFLLSRMNIVLELERKYYALTLNISMIQMESVFSNIENLVSVQSLFVRDIQYDIVPFISIISLLP